MLDLWPGHLIRTGQYDDAMRQLADRHYNRQTPGSPKFAPNGTKIILRDAAGDVLWTWIKIVLERWDGQTGYYCQAFRNESARLSSDIILEAEQHAAEIWGPGRMFTYIDPAEIKSSNPGFCYLMAGWHPHGWSKRRHRRLLVKNDACDLPDPAAPQVGA
jgi:hypothetical protein